MTTNRDRLKYLRKKVEQLGEEVKRKRLQEQYITMEREIVEGKRTIEPVDDAVWEVMLPKERETHLLAYYHTVRVEWVTMEREREEQEKADRQAKAGQKNKFQEWLDSPWIKRLLTGAGLAELTIKLYEAGHHLGLWYRQEEDEKHFKP